MLCLTGVHVLISVAKEHQGLQTTRLSYSDLNRISSSVISCRKTHAPAPSLLDIPRVFYQLLSVSIFFQLSSVYSLCSVTHLQHTIYTRYVMYIGAPDRYQPILPPVQSCGPYHFFRKLQEGQWCWCGGGKPPPSTVTDLEWNRELTISLFGSPWEVFTSQFFSEGPTVVKNSQYMCNFSRRQVHNFPQIFKNLKVQELYIQVKTSKCTLIVNNCLPIR